MINSTFSLPNHVFFFYNKVYTTTHFLFGKVLCVDLSIKLKNMTLLYSYGVGWTPDDTQGVQMLILLLCLFLLRNTSPFFETVWNVVKLILFIIFVIVTAGLAVKWLKKIF